MPTVKSSSETGLVSACLQYLHLRRIVAWRNNTTGVYDPATKRFRKFTGRKGVSDILGILPGGVFLAVETKSKDGRATKEQRTFLDEVNNAGGLGVVVRSVGELIADIDAWQAEREEVRVPL